MKKLSKFTSFLFSTIAAITFSNSSFAQKYHQEDIFQGSMEYLTDTSKADKKQIEQTIYSLKGKIHKRRFEALVSSQNYWLDAARNHCKFRYHFGGTLSPGEISGCLSKAFNNRVKDVNKDAQDILKNPNRNKPVEYESSNLYEIESKITEMQYKNIYELLKKHGTPNYESLQRIKFYIEHYDAWRTFAENFCDFYSTSYRTCKTALYTAKLKLFDRDYKFLTTPPEKDEYMFPDY